MASNRDGFQPSQGADSRDRARQWYLDESLRIAVWEMVFGTGARGRVAELLAQGARWQQERPSGPR